MTTIRELANILSVSTAAISRALNTKPGVSPETRQPVRHLAQDAHYQRNQGARKLTSSQNIWFILHRRQSPQASEPNHIQCIPPFGRPFNADSVTQVERR